MEISSSQLLIVIGVIAGVSAIVVSISGGSQPIGEYNPLSTLAAMGAMVSMLFGKGR